MRKEDEQGMWGVKVMTQVLLGGAIGAACALAGLFGARPKKKRRK